MRRTHSEKSSDRFISSQGQEGKEWNFNVDWIGVVDSVFFVLRGKGEKPVGKRGREHERKRNKVGLSMALLVFIVMSEISCGLGAR